MAFFLRMPSTTIAESRLIGILTRIADELDQIDTRLMELIEAMREPVRVLSMPQASLTEWPTE